MEGGKWVSEDVESVAAAAVNRQRRFPSVSLVNAPLHTTSTLAPSCLSAEKISQFSDNSACETTKLARKLVRKLVRKNKRKLVRKEQIASYVAFEKSERSNVSHVQPTRMCPVTGACVHFENPISSYQSDDMALEKSAAGQRFVN